MCGGQHDWLVLVNLLRLYNMLWISLSVIFDRLLAIVLSSPKLHITFGNQSPIPKFYLF